MEAKKSNSAKGMMTMKGDTKKKDMGKFSLAELAHDPNTEGPRDSPDKHEQGIFPGASANEKPKADEHLTPEDKGGEEMEPGGEYGEKAKKMPAKEINNEPAGSRDVETVDEDKGEDDIGTEDGPKAGKTPEQEADEVSFEGQSTENYKVGGKKKKPTSQPEAKYAKEREVYATKENIAPVGSYASELPTDQGSTDKAAKLSPDMVKFYSPITKIDAARHMVFGYATSGAKDTQGETVDLAASFEAADEWSDWATIKEMHRPETAAGVAVEIEKHAGIGLYIGAEIVDTQAWAKCEKGVYKGFSIGGKCLARDPENPKRITKYQLLEISLVDRPANPDSMFVVAKRDESEIQINASAKGAAGEKMIKEGTPAATPDMAKAAAEKDELIKKLTSDLELSKGREVEMQAKVDELAKQSTVKAEILKAVGELSPELKRAIEKNNQPELTPAQKEMERVSKMSMGELTAYMLKTAHNSAGGTVGDLFSQ